MLEKRVKITSDLLKFQQLLMDGLPYTIIMLFHNEMLLLMLGNCTLQFQRSEKCVCLSYVPCTNTIESIPKYNVLINEDTDLIT